VLNPELVKGPWTKEEDDLVIKLVVQYGPKKWSAIAGHLKVISFAQVCPGVTEFILKQGRIGKQCRERWHNHLNPDIKKEPWTVVHSFFPVERPDLDVNGFSYSLCTLPGRRRTAF